MHGNRREDCRSGSTVYTHRISPRARIYAVARKPPSRDGDIGEMRVMQILADATNTIAAGEVMQLMNVHDPDTTEDDYRQVIYRKTARLFEAGSQIAAVLGGQDAAVESSMKEYGCHLGTAFQLVDDALDYAASAEELGKNIGDDLAEGQSCHSREGGNPA